ncbi:hypothetical protein Tcan_07158 [Toxocara canis]|uniref:Uncharacterized protein n=1 Tax=Toxocara canis TaxID=6265 RepID=A0A0B2VI26_TOXCA|nr:hypothetical protein Tcan_07158 [Toxocara canis]
MRLCLNGKKSQFLSTLQYFGAFRDIPNCFGEILHFSNTFMSDSKNNEAREESKSNEARSESVIKDVDADREVVLNVAVLDTSITTHAKNERSDEKANPEEETNATRNEPSEDPVTQQNTSTLDEQTKNTSDNDSKSGNIFASISVQG